MRTWMFGLTVAVALLMPARTTAAACCGAHDPQTPAGHQHEAAPAASAKDMACCGEHAPKKAGAPAMACCEGHGAEAAPMAEACCDPGVATAPKAMACCDHPQAAPAQAATMACCGDHAPAVTAGCCDTGIPDDPRVAIAGLGLTNPLPVKTMNVHFREPVQVGSAILMGWYVIEHDDDRMARGEPCTYIYEYDTMRAPVATFHCTHLEREAPGVATVVLRPTVNPSIKALAEFQFSGETASHGAPAVR